MRSNEEHRQRLSLTLLFTGLVFLFLLLTTLDTDNRTAAFTVALGDSTSVHAKLRSMLLVMDKLTEMGYTTGSINVSNPEAPSYSPSSPN